MCEVVVGDKMALKRYQVYLADKQMEEVKAMAEARGIPFAEMLRRLIDEYLESKK